MSTTLTLSEQQLKAKSTIISAFKHYQLILKLKRAVLIDHILSLQKSPSTTPSTPSAQTPIASKEEHANVLLNEILSQRAKAASIIIKWRKRLSYRNLIKSILLRRKHSYVISTSIQDAKGLSLEVYSDEGEDLKVYQAEYCPITKESIVYIPKDNNHSLISKMRFKAGGKYIIDPRYTTASDENTFYNVINFKKMLKQENDEALDRRKMISLISKSLDPEHNDRKMHTVASTDRFSKERYGLSKYETKYQSMSVLTGNMKSILKPRPMKRVTSNRKIQFGKVDYSY